MTRETQRIIEAVTCGRYEEALGIASGADRSAVNRAHIRMLYQYRGHPDVRQMLNRAKNALINEKDAQRGRRFYAQGRDVEALSCLLAAVEQRNNVDDHHLIGRILTKLDRNKDAVFHFKQTIVLRGDAVDFFHLGNGYMRIGDYSNSLSCFQKAVTLRGHAIDFQSLGRVYFQLERFDEALKMLSKAYQLDRSVDYQLLKKCRILVLRQRLKTWFRNIVSKNKSRQHNS